MAESTHPSRRPAAQPGCLDEEEAMAFLSEPQGAEGVLSHVETCSGCRLVMAAAARERTGLGARRALSTMTAGDRIGDRYRIERLLARGGMGEVYEAHDELLDEKVALKTILLTALDDRRVLAALKAEVQLARKVSHRNVCRILEFGVHTTDLREDAGENEHEDEDGVLPFFTMELLQGETLRQRLLRTGALAVSDALPIALQVIDGLAAIHAAGIVHRDLKPENVFLLGEGAQLRAVVMDFGLAQTADLSRSLASFTGDGFGAGAVGTLEYMAPEQLRGARPTVTVDVYALGTILFELLTGTRPFAAGAAGALAATLERLDRPAPALGTRLAGAAPGWQRLIARCLARQPQDRYPSMAELRLALTGPIAGQSPGTARRRRRALALGLTLAVALSAAVLLPRWRRDDAGVAPSTTPRAALATPPVVAVAPPPAAAATAPEILASTAHPMAASSIAPADAPRSRPGRTPPAQRRGTSSAALATTPDSSWSEARLRLQRAEELLVAGSVAQACALGEGAAALAPGLPAVHRFLGKCFMRLSKAATGRGHYRRYLQLAPQAPDSLFVRAIVEQRPEAGSEEGPEGGK